MDWKQLLTSISSSVDEELRLRNAYLVTENRLLRKQMQGRVQLTVSERRELAEIGQRLGKKALEEIATIAKPDTILAWHRMFAAQQCDRAQSWTSVGRPRIKKAIEALVVRMARENRSWGYDRIGGALTNLGYTISAQTVGHILKRHSILPAPERKKTVTWQECIHVHLNVLLATDFFTNEIWSWLGFVVSTLLCCIQCLRRHVVCCEYDTASCYVVGTVPSVEGSRCAVLKSSDGGGWSRYQCAYGPSSSPEGSYAIRSLRAHSRMTAPRDPLPEARSCSFVQPLPARYGLAPYDVDTGSVGCRTRIVRLPKNS